MPVVITELDGRRRVNGTTGTREYIITGTTDDADARAALIADSPATWTTTGAVLTRDNAACEVYEGEGTTIYGVAKYASAGTGTLPVDDTAFSFDTTGGTTHIVRSRGTTSYGTSPPATQSLIGVTKDAVEGVDIVSPVFSYQITKRYATASVTSTYIRTLFDSTGTVNSATFSVTTDDGIEISLAAGENLYLGATGGVVDGEVEITHKFAASPNATGLSVGGISAIAKKGWEYLWVLWEDTVSNNFLIKKAKAVYVEQVYPTATHSAVLNP